MFGILPLALAVSYLRASQMLNNKLVRYFILWRLCFYACCNLFPKFEPYTLVLSIRLCRAYFRIPPKWHQVGQFNVIAVFSCPITASPDLPTVFCNFFKQSRQLAHGFQAASVAEWVESGDKM